MGVRARRNTVVCLLLLLVGQNAFGGRDTFSAEPLYTYSVVAVFNHDSQAFTQGLFFDQGMLYEGTGLFGHSSLRRTTLNGEVLQRRLLPNHFFGEGITLFQNRIIQLTWRSRTGLIWDRDTLALVGSFTYPTEGWGVTTDGRHIIMSDGSSSLFFLDPSSFQLIKKLQVYGNTGPVTRLNELEFIYDEIWANIWKDNRIVRINPETGKITGWLDMSELADPFVRVNKENVLNGIAYDKEKDRIFVTGKRWPQLFQIEVSKTIPRFSSEGD